MVVRFWWTHFKVFRNFEPNATITCNFVAPTALLLQMFALQLYLSFVPKGEGLTAARIYFSFFAATYGILGLMFVLGLIFRWTILSVA